MIKALKSRIERLESSQRNEAMAAAPNQAIREKLTRMIMSIPYEPSAEPVDVDDVMADVRRLYGR